MTNLTGNIMSKDASVLGTSRIYAILPQIGYDGVNSASSPLQTPQNYCPTWWLYNVRNDYSFIFKNRADPTISFTCTADGKLFSLSQIINFKQPI